MYGRSGEKEADKQSSFSYRFIKGDVRIRTFGHVRPAKPQISLRIRSVCSESSLCIFWIISI